MTASAVRYLARLLAVASLICAGALHARTVELPKEAPFVRLELPDEWAVSSETPAGIVTSSSMAYSFVVNVAPTIGKRADVDTALAQMVEAIAKEPDFKNAEAGEPSEWEGDNGLWAKGVRIDAQTAADGIPMVLVYQFVEVAPGRYLLVASAATADVDAAEETNYDKVFDSMQPVKQ